MNIDVGKAIRELLYEHPAVIVPGLGGFTSSPNPATVDYVQGVVLPPSKKLEFNPNLVINDGVLIQYLQKSNIITFQEAGDAVSRYVEDVKQALERREIVEIAKVGRLYKDYEHKIRFMPENENFNADSFGLPSVQFTPLVKERPAAAATAAATATVTAPPPPEKKKTDPAPAPKVATSAPATAASSNWIQKMLPWLVLLAAVLIAVSVYFMFGGKKEADEPLAKERVNVKPKAGAAASDETTNNDLAAGEDAKTENPSTAKPSTTPSETNKNSAGSKKETPEKTPPPTRARETFLVVHSFGVRNNARNFAQKLTEAGYAAETKKVGALYRVGVVVSHETEAELEKMRSELGRKYDAKPKTDQELEEQLQ